MDVAANSGTTTAKRWGRASIVNSLLLLPTAALQFNMLFWVLVVTNFALMHGVWVVPLLRRRGAVGFRSFGWPLIAFAVLGNAAPSSVGRPALRSVPRLASAFHPLRTLAVSLLSAI